MVVMLGFVDQEVKKKDAVDWSTNKIGGFPNTMDGCRMFLPKCKLCSSQMYHLTQIYCPLHMSKYHRTLNVFACARKQCWNKPESVTVLRSQLLVETPKEAKKTIDQDDWGVNDWSTGGEVDDWGISTDEKPATEPLPIDDVTTQIKNLNVVSEESWSETNPYFTGYHIYVQEEESLNSACTDSNEYEMKLYQDYVSREGEIKTTTDAASAKNKNQNDSERYEKTQLKHGDELFHQFKKRITNYPEQLIRYEWNGNPLIFSSRSKIHPSLESIPNCPNCNAPRVFELQLMPSLVNYLKDKSTNTSSISANNHEKNGQNGHIGEKNGNGHHTDCKALPINEDEDEIRVEFACLYIFSCSKACWDNGSELCREEFVAIQPDPDVDLLK